MLRKLFLRPIYLFVFYTIYPFLNSLCKSFFSCLRVLIYSRLSPSVKLIRIENSTRAYILGNGPSLKTNLSSNIDLLKSNCLFVVNDFAKSEYYQILKPKYYVLADPIYWITDLHKEYVDAGYLLLKAIKEKTNWPIHLFIPQAGFKTNLFQSFFRENNNIIICNYNSTEIEGFEKVNYFFYKKNLGMPRPQNVLVPCIFLAINIGFTEVNLLGTDHSWTKDLVVNEENEVCFSDSHFYDQGKSKFIPFYDINGNIYKMHQILYDFGLMFEAYQYLRKYADYRKVKVFNRTSESFIDAFERKSIKND
jgi:hypothetical protein